MANLLRDGEQWLAGMMIAHAADTVLYVRGSESVSLAATIGKTDFEIASDFGVETYVSRDFLILTSDLILSAQVVLPQKGDKIEEPVGDAALSIKVYEVMAPASEPVWRYSDPHQKMLRVHTKHVETK